MVTYTLEKQQGSPLYAQLYQHLREDIRSGALPAGSRLPSKRSLAEHLGVSKVTVETAYGQLMAEGYISSREKQGYYVERVTLLPQQKSRTPQAETPPQRTYLADLRQNGVGLAQFPFSVWAKLMRTVTLNYSRELLAPVPYHGAACLREAICDHLASQRGMHVQPSQVVIGAGTEYLYGLILQLLGYEKRYALEDPSYGKISKVYQAHGVACAFLPMDRQGVRMDALEQSGAAVLHLSPAHHFPTGTVTTPQRRFALMQWVNAAPGRYIIEDEYDSEFRFTGRPIPPMQTADATGKVLYINTFSKTIAPSVRISYMILPPALAEAYRERLGFYACTVPAFEQYTLAAFIRDGSFERHINRMKRYYRELRDAVIERLTASPLAAYFTIAERDAGLHFLLRIHTDVSDERLRALCESKGIRIAFLSEYYHAPEAAPPHYALINYSGIRLEEVDAALRTLEAALSQVSAERLR